MIHGGSRPDLAATIMTEDAKTEENTAGGPCGAYIETPCKFAACRVSFDENISHLICDLLRTLLTSIY